tara:strand:+ start:579 stop:1193 length:615 start_codon:yes stop_codon:yes gene_type:complete
MIRKKKDLVTNYTESDLRSFEVLGNFDNYAFDSTNEDNKQHINQTVRYTLSDNMQFKQLMNINTNTKTYSKQNLDNNVYNYDDLAFATKTKYDDSFYKSLDINNFEKLQKFPLNISSHSVKNIIKTEDSKINYTFSDLDAFDRIVKSNEGNTNDKSVKGNDKENNLKSNIDKKPIKIINFDRLEKQKKIDNRQRDKKIKVMYFD